MEQPPRLQTDRLILRPFDLDDVSRLTVQVNVREIADKTLTIPHPYTEDDAREWIGNHEKELAEDKTMTFAVTLAGSGDLIGAVGFRFNLKHDHAEVGYWIGQDYWSHGYGTEAVGAAVAYVFDTLGLNRVFAHCLTRNPASARILEKIGMQSEGCLRQHIKKWDVHEDIDQFGILRAEFDARRDFQGDGARRMGNRGRGHDRGRSRSGKGAS